MSAGAKPGSFKNIAFETGVIAERQRILRVAKFVSFEHDRYGEILSLSDLIEHLEMDEQGPEIPATGHHCGFDFAPEQAIATCKCGAVATNPHYLKGEQK